MVSLGLGTEVSVSFRVKGKEVPKRGYDAAPREALVGRLRQLSGVAQDSEVPQYGWFEEIREGALWTIATSFLPTDSGVSLTVELFPPGAQDQTLESLAVPAATIRKVESAVRARSGVVVVVGNSKDVVLGVGALCNLEPLLDRSVTVLSLSGKVGPAHVHRTGSDDAPDLSARERFEAALTSGFEAVILSEIFDDRTGRALFEDRRNGPFVAAGLHARNTTHGLVRPPA